MIVAIIHNFLWWWNGRYIWTCKIASICFCL